MGKSGFKHCDKRLGKPQTPISMAQLAREGRLKPEAVAAMVRDGKLDDETIAQLRTTGIYPKRYLKRCDGAKQIVFKVPIGVSKNKLRYKIIRLYKYTL